MRLGDMKEVHLFMSHRIFVESTLGLAALGTFDKKNLSDINKLSQARARIYFDNLKNT